MPASGASTVGAAERAPGVKRIMRGRTCRVNKNTLLSLINFGKDDEPTLAVDKVRYKGEPVVAVIADSEAAAMARRQAGSDQLRSAAHCLRCRGGAQARRARRQRDLSGKLFRVSRQIRPSETALRRYEAGVPRRRHRDRGALPDVADRARLDRDQRHDRSARTRQPLRRAFLRAGPVLLARHDGKDPRRSSPTGCISSAARWAADSAARSIR